MWSQFGPILSLGNGRVPLSSSKAIAPHSSKVTTAHVLITARSSSYQIYAKTHASLKISPWLSGFVRHEACRVPLEHFLSVHGQLSTGQMYTRIFSEKADFHASLVARQRAAWKDIFPCACAIQRHSQTGYNFSIREPSQYSQSVPSGIRLS